MGSKQDLSESKCLKKEEKLPTRTHTHTHLEQPERLVQHMLTFTAISSSILFPFPFLCPPPSSTAGYTIAPEGIITGSGNRNLVLLGINVE